MPLSVDTRPQALPFPGCSTGVPSQNPEGPLPISLVSLPLPLLRACGHAAMRLNSLPHERAPPNLFFLFSPYGVHSSSGPHTYGAHLEVSMCVFEGYLKEYGPLRRG